MSSLERLKHGAHEFYRTFNIGHGRERLEEDDFTMQELEQLVAGADGQVSFTDMRYRNRLTYTYMEPEEAVDCLEAEFGANQAGEIELTYTYDRVDDEIGFTITERVDPSRLGEDCWYREALEAAEDDRPERYIMHGAVETDATEDDLLQLV